MTLSNHFGIFLIFIFICNVVEIFNENPFNNEIVNVWFIPTAAGIFLFILMEILFGIIYLITKD